MLGRERRCLGQFTQSPGQACCSRSFQRWYCNDLHCTFQVSAAVSGSLATMPPSSKPYQRLQIVSPLCRLPICQTLNWFQQPFHPGRHQSGSESIVDLRRTGQEMTELHQRRDENKQDMERRGGQRWKQARRARNERDIYRAVCSFPKAAIIKYPRLRGLRQQKCLLL